MYVEIKELMQERLCWIYLQINLIGIAKIRYFKTHNNSFIIIILVAAPFISNIEYDKRLNMIFSSIYLLALTGELR